MAFVLTHQIPTIGRRAAGLWARFHLTPQERANLHTASTRAAVMTASLGGHPR